MWAFGIVLWEMFMKTVPFQNMEDDKVIDLMYDHITIRTKDSGHCRKRELLCVVVF